MIHILQLQLDFNDAELEEEISPSKNDDIHKDKKEKVCMEELNKDLPPSYTTREL